MGVTRAKAAENHEAVVAAADALFRDRGVEAVGLVELMAAAGLTRGGFYNHFSSKAELVEHVVARAMGRGLAALKQAAADSREHGGDALADQFDWYLSPAHRADLAGGCPNAGFVGDARRLDEPAMRAYARGLAENLERFEQLVADAAGTTDRAKARASALALFSEMLGAVVLARAVVAVDPELADEISDAARADLHKRTGH